MSVTEQIRRIPANVATSATVESVPVFLILFLPISFGCRPATPNVATETSDSTRTAVVDQPRTDVVDERSAEEVRPDSQETANVSNEELLARAKKLLGRCEECEKRWDAGEHGTEVLTEWRRVSDQAVRCVTALEQPASEVRFETGMAYYHRGISRVRTGDKDMTEDGLQDVWVALIQLSEHNPELADKVRNILDDLLPAPVEVYVSRASSDSQVLAMDQILRNVRRYGGVTMNEKYSWPRRPWVVGGYCFLWTATGWNPTFYDHAEPRSSMSAVTSRSEAIEYLKQCQRIGARTVVYDYNIKERSAYLEVSVDVLIRVLEKDSAADLLD